jgi:hypothetical protein
MFCRQPGRETAAKWSKLLIFILLLKKSSEIGRDQKLRGGREIEMYSIETEM